MWNDTEIPLAIFFTFRSYGTWLHGDHRTSVDRHNNSYNSPRIPTNRNWLKFNNELLKYEPVLFNKVQRECIANAIKEICAKRKWTLFVVSARSNHVHAVVSIGTYDSKRARATLKSNATKGLREKRLWNFDHSPWADKGSCRKLWNENDVDGAIAYVRYEQGED